MLVRECSFELASQPASRPADLHQGFDHVPSGRDIGVHERERAHELVVGNERVTLGTQGIDLPPTIDSTTSATYDTRGRNRAPAIDVRRVYLVHGIVGLLESRQHRARCATRTHTRTHTHTCGIDHPTKYREFVQHERLEADGPCESCVCSSVEVCVSSMRMCLVSRLRS